MLQRILLRIDFKSSLERSYLARLSHVNNALLLRMTKNSITGLLVVIEYIVLHRFVSSFFVISIFIRLCVFNCHSDNCFNKCLLFLVESIVYFAYSLSFARLLLSTLFLLIGHLAFLLLRIIRMNNNIFIPACCERINDLATIFTMSHYRINICARISSSKNETKFSNYSVNHISSYLLKLVRIDRQRSYISMLNKFFCRLPRFCVVERTISIYSIFSIFENGMAKNCVNISMLMTINKRYCCSIIVFKCVLFNGSTICAKQIVSSGPSTKIIVIHFEFLLLLQKTHYQNFLTYYRLAV